MVLEIHAFDVSVPAGTLRTSPLVTALSMPARIVRWFTAKVPQSDGVTSPFTYAGGTSGVVGVGAAFAGALVTIPAGEQVDVTSFTVFMPTANSGGGTASTVYVTGILRKNGVIVSTATSSVDLSASTGITFPCAVSYVAGDTLQMQALFARQGAGTGAMQCTFTVSAAGSLALSSGVFLQGLRISANGVQQFPINVGAWISADNELLREEIESPISSGSWQVEAFNEDSFAHTIEIRFGVDLPQAPGALTVMQPVQV